MTGYERRDIRFAAIAKGLAGLAALLAVVALLAAATLRALGGRVPAIVRRSPAPEPRLLSDPVEELRRFRAEEDAALNGYGWVDRPRGIVRIPIGRAMALLLRRGLPTRGAAGGRR